MSSPAVQLSFTLRTSPNVRTVHLVGSWDGYKAQLPLSVVKDATAKPGSWKGTFRFQGAQALKLGSRYWYYYIVDGYHVSHDPAKEHTVEKTTGRKLNILNVPAPAKQPAPVPTSRTEPRASTQAKTPTTARLPQGRALSPGKIAHPRPQKPYASRNIREADYENSPVDELDEKFGNMDFNPRYASSPSELSDCSEASGTVFSSSSGSSSSATSESDSDERCRCNRFGLTRSGQRVKLDCGGKRCGYTESSSECDSDEDSDEDSEEELEREQELRRRALLQERARNGVKPTQQVDARGRAIPASATARAPARAPARR